MGFSRKEYWIVLPFPFPGNLPDPGIEPVSPALAGGFFTPEPPGEPCDFLYQEVTYLKSSRQRVRFVQSLYLPGSVPTAYDPETYPVESELSPG